MTDDTLSTAEALAQAQTDLRQLKDVQLSVTLDGTSAFQILAQLQLAARHPDNHLQPASAPHLFAIQLQLAISITPALAALAAVGWDPQEDLYTPAPAGTESAPEAGESERNATDASVNASIDASKTPA